MGQQWILVVPKQLRGDILRSLHDAPTTGHLGFAKTYDRIRRKSEEARQLAKIHIKDAQASDKRRYDARHRSVSYEIGDLVWVYTPIRKVGLSEKLLHLYFGPYRITRQMSEVTYEVESMETDKKRRKLKDVVHVLRIKPYYEPKKQLGEEENVVVSKRAVIRSQTRKQRDAVL
ncbi:hypothetical protein AVEN_223088-1 [Araneus ventricosus]|uniref:Uncharacterized protein n=1 Tax=Araneus ventricosus TaxID=182803 RepID=A0A4Y2VLN4_ARAVE|nr:hypothetical protein AVEN_269389-1 [Araneus ventricosus]GBO25494.1 hypothetical protein AVEN_201710-1 [Araneus ventricosus]GBO25522.1 hypothetical protein AVEN_158210-1 [Araneus ventricosus]GBO25547.1 hypothetical protein AVEN_223088-1 [Araneus ventricosus]